MQHLIFAFTEFGGVSEAVGEEATGSDSSSKKVAQAAAPEASRRIEDDGSAPALADITAIQSIEIGHRAPQWNARPRGFTS
ncbi:hypothetical protein OZ411_15140 [Bradyrhizobium sp. Arg237L]|uniref:hypothetical protein n=1 Tax=Bradyrhizobium sp. Arg237L TaxID=3003352 RepID=UPI00249F468C|nr:hypothetical protein [Bradyrhizobium sp. Arg237L]MDI4234148.1 hypothetical protein [Bradyrhizobium sp. Arg237L]